MTFLFAMLTLIPFDRDMDDETTDNEQSQYDLFHQQLPSLISCPRCSQPGTPPLPSGNADHLKVCRSPPPSQAGQVMYKDLYKESSSQLAKPT
jgi:hypothetical protein